MFQLADNTEVGLLAQLTRFVAVSDCERSSRGLEASIFSYSSENLETQIEAGDLEALRSIADGARNEREFHREPCAQPNQVPGRSAFLLWNRSEDE